MKTELIETGTNFTHSRVSSDKCSNLQQIPANTAGTPVEETVSDFNFNGSFFEDISEELEGARK